jgi:hypothetical protein
MTQGLPPFEQFKKEIAKLKADLPEFQDNLSDVDVAITEYERHGDEAAKQLLKKQTIERKRRSS